MTTNGSVPRKVMIATPAKSSDNVIHYTLALAHTMYRAGRMGLNLYPKFLPNDSFIQHARNRLLRYMLEEGCHDIIFADADNDWEPDWVFDLLRHPVDCVGGTYPRKQDEERYELRSIACPVPRCPKTGLLIVDHLGAGFLRLSRFAVGSLWDRSMPYTFKGEQLRLICDTPIINGAFEGEDVTLCAKLGELGIPVYLDQRMTLGHTGPKRWTGDVRPWLAKIEMAQIAKSVGPDVAKALP
jgi:hypothetical protein